MHVFFYVRSLRKNLRKKLRKNYVRAYRKKSLFTCYVGKVYLLLRKNKYFLLCFQHFKMAAFNKSHMLAAAMIILRRRRRRRQKDKKCQRKFWIRPTNIDRHVSGAYISTFLPAI